MNPASDRVLEPSPTPDAHSFVIAGVSLRQSFSKLKPALPKKRVWEGVSIVISATSTRVTFSLTGAAVGMPALTSGPFNAEIPLVEFHDFATRKYDNGDLISIEIGPGHIRVLGITTKSPNIRIGSLKPEVLKEETETEPVITNPLDAPMGLPLLSAYAYIRRHGVQPTLANKLFVEQQIEVDRLLEKTSKLLAPLGVSRTDIESILDKRVVSGE